jgi:hypothetical protein
MMNAYPSNPIAIGLPRACRSHNMVGSSDTYLECAGRTMGHRVAAGRCGVRGLEPKTIRCEGNGHGGVLLQDVKLMPCIACVEVHLLTFL